MKKSVSIILTLIQLIFVGAAVAAQQYSMKRMGMMRFVLLKNNQWASKYPVELIKYVSIFILIVAFVGLIFKATRKAKGDALSMGLKTELIIDGTISLFLLVFLISQSPMSFRAYYFIGLIMAFVVIIQHVKIFFMLKAMD